jgi:hypothetical protein
MQGTRLIEIKLYAKVVTFPNNKIGFVGLLKEAIKIESPMKTI